MALAPLKVRDRNRASGSMGDGTRASVYRKKARISVPVVIMTGYADTATLEKEAGWYDILRKPFNLAELAVKVDGVLRRVASAAAIPSSKLVPIRPS
jgi:DNA-binding response OmpR family regulator